MKETDRSMDHRSNKGLGQGCIKLQLKMGRDKFVLPEQSGDDLMRVD